MNLFNALLDILFPPRCLICRTPGEEIFCKSCIQKIKYIHQYCPICGKPQESLQEKTCGDCLSSKPVFDLARSVAIYDGVIKQAIHKFKFRGKRVLSTPLSGLLIKYLEGYPFGVDLSKVTLITMVPLYRDRERKRGFNQSQLLATLITKHYNVPFKENILVRTRKTRPQFDLKRSERFTNVAGAFRVTREEAISGKTILLIDDILTTGATVSECAKALKQGGASRVFVLTLSRAIED